MWSIHQANHWGTLQMISIRFHLRSIAVIVCIVFNSLMAVVFNVLLVIRGDKSELVTRCLGVERIVSAKNSQFYCYWNKSSSLCLSVPLFKRPIKFMYVSVSLFSFHRVLSFSHIIIIVFMLLGSQHFDLADKCFHSFMKQWVIKWSTCRTCWDLIFSSAPAPSTNFKHKLASSFYMSIERVKEPQLINHQSET